MKQVANCNRNKLEMAIIHSGASGTMLQQLSDFTKGTYLTGWKLQWSLIPVGQACDKKKTVVFTHWEAIILNLTGFTLNMYDIVDTVPRNKCTGLHKFHKGLTPTRIAFYVRPYKEINISSEVLSYTNIKLLKTLEENAVDFLKLSGNLQPNHPCLLATLNRNASLRI